MRPNPRRDTAAPLWGMTRRSVPYIITASNVLSAFATGAVRRTSLDAAAAPEISSCERIGVNQRPSTLFIGDEGRSYAFL